MRNQTPFALCIIGGLLLIAANYAQGIETIFLVYGFLHSISALSQFFLVIDIILLILFLIAWSGGAAVIIGGFLLTKSHVRLGKFIIAIAAGFGLITFIILVIWVLITGGVWVLLFGALAAMNTVTGLGLILTLVARSMAK
ncbi:MAG: hypothetical protein RTU92_12815 [Candidatus Thorarchaeota archaeon]